MLNLLLALALTSEIAVGELEYREAWATQSVQSVATNGEGYFAVWWDYRIEPRALVGTRLDANGAVLDAPGIVIARGETGPPHVVWTGAYYLVLWNGQARIMAALIDRDGRLAAEPRVLFHDTYLFSDPVSNGSVTVVPYHHAAAGLRAAALDVHGNLVRDTGISTATGFPSVDVATDGDEFLAVWSTNDSKLRAVRLDARGALIDETPHDLGNGGTPVVASDGEDYLVIAFRGYGHESFTFSPDTGAVSARHQLVNAFVPTPVWTGTEYAVLAVRSRGSGDYSVVRLRLDRDGRPTADTVLEEATYDASLAAASHHRNVLFLWADDHGSSGRNIVGTAAPSAITDASQPAYPVSLSANAQLATGNAHGAGIELVTWQEDDGSHAARITADGRVLDAGGMDLGNGVVTSVVFDGKQFVLTLQESPHAYVKFVSPANGLLGDEIRLDNAGAPSLAAGADSTLLVWMSGAPGALRAALISRDTRALHGAPVVVKERANDDRYMSSPRAAWNGSAFLIVWSEYEMIPFGSHPPFIGYRAIAGARINASLTLADSAPIEIARAESSWDPQPRIAFDGSGWLVTWHRPEDERVLARRIDAEGASRDPITGVPLARGMFPDVTWDGARNIIAWLDGPAYASGTPAPRALRYTVVERGAPLDATNAKTLVETYERVRPSLASAAFGMLSILYTRNAFEPQYGSVPRAFLQRIVTAPKRRAR